MDQNWLTALVTLAVGLFGGGALATVLVKAMSKNVDNATAEKITAEARETAVRTAATEVDTLREVIAEVRASEARKDERIDALEGRLEKLEERERHALTRAAVHEAWDRLAFQRIIVGDESFPPPPPLTGPDDPSTYL